MFYNMAKITVIDTFQKVWAVIYNMAEKNNRQLIRKVWAIIYSMAGKKIIDNFLEKYGQ